MPTPQLAQVGGGRHAEKDLYLLDNWHNERLTDLQHARGCHCIEAFDPVNRGAWVSSRSYLNRNIPEGVTSSDGHRRRGHRYKIV